MSDLPYRQHAILTYALRVHALEAELAALRSEMGRWMEWGAHVYTCPNSNRNGSQQECPGCVSPGNEDRSIQRDAGIK